MPQADLCSRCGAPAPAGASSCPFCGTAFAGAAPAPAKKDELPNFINALLVEHAMPEALSRAAVSAFPGDGDAPAMARAVAKLADSFQRTEKVKLDGMALARIFSAYRIARVELRETAESTMNLPFLTADGSGPKHFEKKLRRADLAQLET